MPLSFSQQYGDLGFQAAQVIIASSVGTWQFTWKDLDMERASPLIFVILAMLLTKYRRHKISFWQYHFLFHQLIQSCHGYNIEYHCRS